MAGLVPEIVPKLGVHPVLPDSGHVKRLTVQKYEAPWNTEEFWVQENENGQCMYGCSKTNKLNPPVKQLTEEYAISLSLLSLLEAFFFFVLFLNFISQGYLVYFF